MRRLPVAEIVCRAGWVLLCVSAQAAGQIVPDPQKVDNVVVSTPGMASSAASLQMAGELPDSPGTVLRRRTEFQNAVELAEVDGADDRQQAEASAARASDKRGGTACGTTANTSATRGNATASVAGANAMPGRMPMSTAPDAGTRGAGSASASNVPGSSGGSGNGVSPVACPAPVAVNPYTRFLNSTTPIPLTPRQKAHLAIHNLIDPGNIVTILGTSGIAIASDSHTAYGPGWKGFGENAGLSFVQDATGDFFGTFLIPSIAHEDPHYHRRPEAGIPRRIVHAVSRTVIAQGDDGHPMPNYSTLLTYPITEEIANLYVPGVASNGPATVERILTGYATDPIDNLITEFLPDVAKRVHVRVIFVQQIINQVAAGQPVSMF